MIRSPTFQHCEISKKLTLNPRLSAKNTPLFLFPNRGHSLQIFAKVMPLHTHLFSFTHNAVVLSHFRCVHSENQTKFFWFLHFYESKQISLTQDLRWSLEQSIAQQLQRQTDLLLCTINCFPQWAHLQNMAVGDLAFYYTLYLWISLRLNEMFQCTHPDSSNWLHRSHIMQYHCG